MPKVFNTTNKRNLAQMWAFKYEPKCPGIDIHADFAAVNVNFWITPTQANKDYDPEKDVGKTGGMWIWDKGAPPDWDFVRYNGDDKTEVLEYLKDAGAIYVPYKYNRCVMFDSNLFHKTADVNFHPGWDNRRVNVTMLFGRREADEGVEPTDMLESKAMHKKTTKTILEKMQEVAHERECIVRTEATQRQIESLTGRIRRLEALIMGSTMTLIAGFVTIFWKM